MTAVSGGISADLSEASYIEGRRVTPAAAVPVFWFVDYETVIRIIISFSHKHLIMKPQQTQNLIKGRNIKAT